MRLRSITSGEKENVSCSSTNIIEPASVPKSESIFFGVPHQKSDITSSYFTQSTNPALKKNKMFLSIPKANYPSNHIPPSIVANLASRSQSAPDGSCTGCPESSKKRQVEDVSDPSLVPIKNVKKKAKPLSLFDALSDSKNEQTKSKRKIDSAPNVPATNIARETLIRDKLLDDQRRGTKKRIKIIPNKSEATKKPVTMAADSQAQVFSKNETLWDENFLIHGNIEIFYSSMQKVVKPDMYPIFKKVLSKFRTVEISSIASELAAMLVESDNSKILFRAFVRLLNGNKAEEFCKKCEQITGKRPLGF